MKTIFLSKEEWLRERLFDIQSVILNFSYQFSNLFVSKYFDEALAKALDSAREKLIDPKANLLKITREFKKEINIAMLPWIAEYDNIINTLDEQLESQYQEFKKTLSFSETPYFDDYFIRMKTDILDETINVIQEPLSEMLKTSNENFADVSLLCFMQNNPEIITCIKTSNSMQSFEYNGTIYDSFKLKKIIESYEAELSKKQPIFS